MFTPAAFAMALGNCSPLERVFVYLFLHQCFQRLLKSKKADLAKNQKKGLREEAHECISVSEARTSLSHNGWMEPSSRTPCFWSIVVCVCQGRGWVGGWATIGEGYFFHALCSFPKAAGWPPCETRCWSRGSSDLILQGCSYVH